MVQRRAIFGRRHFCRINSQQTVIVTPRLYVQMKMRDLLATGIAIGLPKIQSGRIEGGTHGARDPYRQRHYRRCGFGIERVNVLDMRARHYQHVARNELAITDERNR